MRENGREEEKRENWSLKVYSLEKSVIRVSSLGAFIAKTPLQNYKNNIANTITMGAKREENHKSQKAKTGSRNEQWQQEKHSCSAPIFFTFCSSFLMGSDLQR